MSRFALFITGFMIVISPSLPGDGHARDLYFSPLFSYESGDGGPAFDGLGPVLDFSGTHTAVRPLYYRDRENETSCIVYPLGKTTPGHAYFAPFMRWRTEGDNSSFDLFPYFSGTHEGRNYSGLFPLYGKAYHRYGYDEARFALWPLYTETQRDGGTTYTLLWPVFSYRSHELFRVFPLYGAENSADSTYTFALWPVFHHEQRADGGGMAAVLPLFRTEYGPAHWNASVLWPFFTYNRDEAAKHTSLDLPWPVIRLARGGYEETRIFPLYWFKDEGPKFRRLAVLWPLWVSVSSSGRYPGEHEKTTSVLVLNRLTEKTSGTTTTSRSLTVWPLVHCTREQEKRTWSFPALIPFYGDEGFNRTWGDLLTLARGSRDGSSSCTNILWKSFYQEQEPGRSRWSLLFLVSHRETPEYTEWGFLGNLIRFRGMPGPAQQALP